MIDGDPAESLTPRQRQVVQLVAEGLTNREIAERLFISERTAEGHVEQIRVKLGLSNRVQISRWVAANRSGQTVLADSDLSEAVRDTAASDSLQALPSQANGRERSALPGSRRRRLWLAALVLVAASASMVALLSTGLGGSGDVGPTVRDIPTAVGALARPIALAVGPDGVVYVAEQNQVVSVSASGAVTPFAGGMVASFSGDGGPARRAELNGPRALAVDDVGDVYIADTGNNRIRRVAPDGTITTVAGNGTASFSGDGGAATGAGLNGPSGLAIGFGRAVYIADTGNNRVRYVQADGTITTVAGTGDPGYAGDGSAATSALLDSPQGLAFDHEGDLFIADSLNDRIRQVDPFGTITTIAGDGQQGFSGDGTPGRLASLNLAAGPLEGTGGAIAVNDAGRLYVADGFNNRIRAIDLGGSISTIAGEGQPGYNGSGRSALSAQLNLPLGIAIDSFGRVYIADTANNRVRILS